MQINTVQTVIITTVSQLPYNYLTPNVWLLNMVTINCAVHFIWCTVYTGSATQVSPAAIRIHHLKNFDSELQLINAGFVQSPVLFSGQGEKLLKRHKQPGHNLGQYGICQKQGLNFINQLVSYVISAQLTTAFVSLLYVTVIILYSFLNSKFCYSSGCQGGNQCSIGMCKMSM